MGDYGHEDEESRVRESEEEYEERDEDDVHTPHLTQCRSLGSLVKKGRRLTISPTGDRPWEIYRIWGVIYPLTSDCL